MKHYISQKYKIKPDFVKIVTVMPCYDKKLEAVRPNFNLLEVDHYNDINNDGGEDQKMGDEGSD